MAGIPGNCADDGRGEDRVGRLVRWLARRPSIALMRRYADWVEHTSEIQISGPGASYAGSAVYVCSAFDVPLVYLHRAHYDDRALLAPERHVDPLALFAHAAGLVVSRGHATPPELERSVRAGNGAIFVVGRDGAAQAEAERAATLAVRTRAPVIPLRATTNRAVRVDVAGRTMSWPAPRGVIRIDYGAPVRLEDAASDAAARIAAMV